MPTPLPQADIIRRVLAKPALRTELIDHPKRFLHREFGIDLGPQVTVKVVTCTKDEVWVVIPSLPNLRGDEDRIPKGLLDRFRSDPAYRSRVLQDPASVYKELTGRVAPASPRVHVVEETPALRYLQLPAALPRNAFQPAAAESTWGGGGGGGWGGEPPEESPDGSCFDSMIVNCCETDFMNTESTWNCCYPDTETSDGGPVR